MGDDPFDGTDAERGPVGSADDETEVPGPEEVTPGWEDLQDPQWGLSGLVNERQPHDACDLCFTVPNRTNAFQIYEYVETDGEEAIIVPRRIPNPAPLAEGEVRDMVDADGEPVWYIGRQGIVGPNDEAPWSEAIPESHIELKRIQARHMYTIMNIPGVHQFGIGETGFTVGVLPDHEDSISLVPTDLEGVPVTVEIRDIAVAWGHEHVRSRPIPVGAGVGSVHGRGSLEPHVVRDRPVRPATIPVAREK